MRPKQPKMITEQEAAKQGIDEGSKLVKKLAAEQRITITLSAEVIESIKRQWEHWDTSKPAEIIFAVGSDMSARLRVAAYAYKKDTCCV